MKLSNALAVGLLLAGSSFGASIIDATTFNNLCTAAGSNCGNVTFNTADQSITAPLFGPLGIVSTANSSLTSAAFSGGVPTVNGPLGNQGNGYLDDVNDASTITISVDAGPLSALAFTVDQGIYGDGQGLLFTLLFSGGGSQQMSTLDNCIGGGGAFAACPTTLRYQAGGGQTITGLQISGATTAEGPERFTFYNFRYILAGEIEEPVEPGEVPEPTTFGLMGAALLGLGAYRKFRK